MNILDCLGVGQIASNKNSDTDEVFVYLPLNNPSQDGENIAQITEENTQIQTSTGDIESRKVLSTNAEPAKWLSFESNRLTPPDVVRGTKVRIYQYKGSNDYYWTLDGLDGTIKLSTVIWVFPASSDIDANTPITPDNYYMAKIDSVGGKTEFITGMGNGEYSPTQTTWDYKEGYFGMQDDQGNMLVFNWKERSLNFVNADGSILTIDKENFSLIVKGEGLLSADKYILVKTKDLIVQAENSTTLKTETFTSDTKRTVMTASDGFELFGNVKLNGELLATKRIKSMVDVLAGNVSGIGHMHGGVQSGGSKTSQPI